MKKKSTSFFKRYKSFFSFKRKKKKNIASIRSVYFGLRIRFLVLFSIVIFFIISILTTIMYFNQRELLEDEKNIKAKTLTQILSGPAKFYLDKTAETSDEALRLKYEIIKKEASNFKAYNSDIVKIILTNEKGAIRFSTDRDDFSKKSVFPYIQHTLNKEEGVLSFYDFSEKEKDPKTKKTTKIRYRAISSPIYLSSGPVIDRLKDFDKYYKLYHKSKVRKRKYIYRRLWRKYKDLLDEEFNPYENKDANGTDDKIQKAWDIDFLFLHLFRETLSYRKKFLAKNDRWLLQDSWLFKQKENIKDAYTKDLPVQAKKHNDVIMLWLEKLAGEVDKVRKLGMLAVVFNTDKIQNELDKNISQTLKIALYMIIVSCIAILFVLHFKIQNLKKLEKWAISISEGNINSKIHIKTKDEIGRLGDIFNHMIDELKVKYHLEKYVSKSTHSMIRGKKEKADEIDLGGTGRANMVFIFSDVRGFTSFSERNEPEIVIEVLNFYLELQSNIIKANKGDIADYVGDEIMAQFSGERRIDRAIATAVKMRKEISKANEERLKEGLPIFDVGIGINGGEVVVGNIGSSFRMDYACVGDAVNLASRLCSAAKAGEIIVSKEIFKQAKRKYNHKEYPSIAVKGKAQKIGIVNVLP